VTLLTAVLDVLFPPRCAACATLLPGSDAPSTEGALCSTCETTLEPIQSACERCGLPGPPSLTCVECDRHPPAFDSCRTVWLYGEAIARVLHRFKYEDQPALAGPLGDALARLPLPEVDAVVPVPLHPKRRRERTYDQALYLAQRVAEARKLPVEQHLLVRVRSTARQVGQSRAQRVQNIHGAFEPRGTLQGKRLLLIDDVVTTGATASECARALKSAGALQVHVASVARAV